MERFIKSTKTVLFYRIKSAILRFYEHYFSYHLCHKNMTIYYYVKVCTVWLSVQYHKNLQCIQILQIQCLMAQLSLFSKYSGQTHMNNNVTEMQ